jgi:hypothetical protein
MLYDERWDRKPAVDECGQMLLRAADYIEEHGWCQSRVMDKEGRVCLLGAILYVGGTGLDFMPRVEKAAGIGQGGLIACWNNAPGRTKQEVVDVLRRAAYTEE